MNFLEFNRFHEALKRKTIKQALIGDQHHAFGLRLRDKETVEWVFVSNVDLAGQAGMRNANWKLGEALSRDDGFKVLSQQFCARKFADTKFGSHFHRRGRAHRDAVVFIRNRVASALAQSVVACQPPDECMGIEQ